MHVLLWNTYIYRWKINLMIIWSDIETRLWVWSKWETNNYKEVKCLLGNQILAILCNIQLTHTLYKQTLVLENFFKAANHIESPLLKDILPYRPLLSYFKGSHSKMLLHEICVHETKGGRKDINMFKSSRHTPSMHRHQCTNILAVL